MTQIHPTAIVQSGAELGEGVEIGPYCVIGPHVRIGAGTRLHAHVVMDNHTTLGDRCEVHPFARLGGYTQDLKFAGGNPRVEIGNGTVLREYVTVNTATKDGDVTRVGSKCLIMANAHVAHDCVVEDEVILANSVALAGHVVVEKQAIIGGICGVHQFVRVGRMAIIGGVSRVIQDVPPFMMAADNPLRVSTINIVGLRRRGVSEEVIKRIKRAHHLIYRENLTVAAAIDRMEKELEPCDELSHLAAFLKKSERGISR